MYKSAAATLGFGTGGVERAKIDSTGLNLVTGDMMIAGATVISSTRQVRSADGILTAPGYAFGSETNTGLYKPAAGAIGMSVLGVERARLTATELTVTGNTNVTQNIQVNGTTILTSARLAQTADGAAAGPAYSFNSEPTMGIFRPSAGIMAFGVGSSERGRFDASGLRLRVMSTRQAISA